MTMIERVARAMAQRQMEADQKRAEAGGCDIMLKIDAYLPWARDHVRANIEAMREPTKEMLRSGYIRADAEWIGGARDLPKEEIARLWDAMIDAASEEKT